VGDASDPVLCSANHSASIERHSRRKATRRSGDPIAIAATNRIAFTTLPGHNAERLSMNARARETRRTVVH